MTLLLTGCTSKDAVPQSVTHSVVLVSPQLTGDVKTKELSGIIEPAHEISFGFKTAGQIERILVKEGDYVREGQLLAVIDDRDVRLEVEATQIQYDQLQREVERMKKLLASKSISGNDYDKAVSGLAQLEVNLRGTKRRQEYTRLYAPTSGYVQRIDFEASEMVNAGTPVFTLIDASRVEVVCNIPTSLYMQRDRIASVACRGQFSDGKWCELTCQNTTPMADGNQLYKMRMVLKEHPKQSISGQNVTVRISMKDASGEEQITIPMSSVLHADGKAFVMQYHANDSTVHRKPVVLGETDKEGNIIIRQGLIGSEQLVKAGATRLKDGEKVNAL